MRFVAGVRPLESLLGVLRGCLDRFPDKRRGVNTTYGMGDIGMAAFLTSAVTMPTICRRRVNNSPSACVVASGTAAHPG
jgi:hypothetical protein